MQYNRIAYKALVRLTATKGPRRQTLAPADSAPKVNTTVFVTANL